MQKQKFDEIISYVNKKVSEMEIETKYKMELLGMVTALGYAHEKETHDKRTETHACDCISRQTAIDGLDGHYIERRNLNDWQAGWNAALDWMGSTYLDEFPSAQFDKDIDVPSNDTISRQAAVDAIKKRADKARDMIGSDHPFWEGLIVALDIVELLPSAQPEIIYCKDCKHYALHSLFGRSYGLCERLCYYDRSLTWLTKGDNFCSYAERRTDERFNQQTGRD